MSPRCLLPLVLLLACGRDATGPTPLPTPAPLAPLSAIDGITGAPVAAAITTGGVTTASASGYLLRETVQRGGILMLWPTAPAASYHMPEPYVREIVYAASPEWPLGWWTDRLLRWEGPLTLGLGPGLKDVSGAEEQLDRVVTELSKLPWVSVSRAETGASVVYDVTALSRTDDQRVAEAQRYFRGHTIVRAEARFQDVATFRRFSVVMHETGHVLGLWHSPHRDDLMHGKVRPWAGRAEAPSGHETALLAMMYAQRRPGNAWPDRDTDLGALAGVERMLTIRCE